MVGLGAEEVVLDEMVEVVGVGLVDVGLGVAVGAHGRFCACLPSVNAFDVVSAVTVGAGDKGLGLGAGVAGEVGLLMAALAGGGLFYLVGA